MRSLKKNILEDFGFSGKDSALVVQEVRKLKGLFVFCDRMKLASVFCFFTYLLDLKQKGRPKTLTWPKLRERYSDIDDEHEGKAISPQSDDSEVDLESKENREEIIAILRSENESLKTKINDISKVCYVGIFFTRTASR